MARAAVLVSAAILALSLVGVSGGDTGSDPGARKETILAAAREIMREAHYCSLVTIGEDGHPAARAMDPFPPEDDLTVWLATHSGSRKVAHIRSNPRVTLYYFHPAATGYVSLIGTAEPVTDPQEKARHWKGKWRSHYADGHRGEDYLLLRVRPLRLEVLSYPHGLRAGEHNAGPVILKLSP